MTRVSSHPEHRRAGSTRSFSNYATLMFVSGRRMNTCHLTIDFQIDLHLRKLPLERRQTCKKNVLMYVQRLMNIWLARDFFYLAKSYSFWYIYSFNADLQPDISTGGASPAHRLHHLIEMNACSAIQRLSNRITGRRSINGILYVKEMWERQNHLSKEWGAQNLALKIVTQYI